MLADESLQPLIERFGCLRTWIKSVEVYGFPPTWSLPTNHMAELVNQMEAEDKAICV